MKPWAEQFYNSDAWRSCRDSFLKSKGGLCERCSTPHDPIVAKIAHHKTYLTKQNINDPNVALSWDNLEALCQDCHNKEHKRNDKKRRYMFDEEGTADIKRAERAIRAWCSVPDKKNAKPLEDWQYITDFRALHDEFPELVDKNGKGWLYRHIANIVAYVKKNILPFPRMYAPLMRRMSHPRRRSRKMGN